MDTFYDEEIEKLRGAYQQMQEVKSEGNGSAFGEHYKLARLLRSFGVSLDFESSSQIENVVEHIITYGEVPDVY